MNEVVLITGGSRGIGYACVKKFLSNNWEIVVTSRNPPPILNKSVHFCRANFYNMEEIVSMAEHIKTNYRPLKAVIHCVGDIIEDNTINQLDLDILYKTFQINFFSAVMIAKQFYEVICMTKGVFVFITSVAKDRIYPNIPAYCAAKASLSNFIKSLSSEIAPYGARAVGVSPGVVDTNLFRKSKYTIDEASKWHKLGRVGKPEEVASLIYYLVSEDAKWITGVDYIIDGGMLL